MNIGVNGELSNFPTHYCNRKFLNTDSLYLYLRWSGLGGGTRHEIQGIKKNLNTNYKKLPG